MISIRTLFRYEKPLVLLFIGIIAFFSLGANIFAGQISAPMDLLLQYPGFYESGFHLPSVNPERSDWTAGGIPSFIFVRDQVLKGNFPFWDPLRAGGIPTNVPDTPIISLFFRPDFLSFLILGNGVGYTVGIISKLVILGFGTYLLCRKWLDMIPAVFAGTTIMLSGFIIVWLYTPVPSSIGWTAWLLWSVKNILDKPSSRNLAIVTSIVTMEFVSGFEYLAAFSIYLAIAFGIGILFSKYRKGIRNLRKSFLYCSIGLILGIVISMAYFFPMFEWLEHSDLGNRYGYSSLSINDFDILWNPFKYTMNIENHLVPEAEHGGYIGLTAIILLPLSIVGFFLDKRRLFLPILFWMIVSLITLVIVFNIEPLSTFIYKIHPFSSSLNNRSLGMLGFQLSVLSAFGLQQIINGIRAFNVKSQIRNYSKTIAYVGVVIILIIQIISLAPLVTITDAVVPANSWYPPTPTLDYVKQNILPGQKIVASSSAYMIGGSLQGYGLPEWFSLGAYFKPQQQIVLDNIVYDAWRNPAAAQFTGGNLRLDSDYNNALFVRYVLALKTEVNLSAIPDNWQVTQKSPDIVILENKNCPPGAYLIPEGKSLKDLNWNSTIIDNIKTVSYSTNYEKYVYDGTKKGYLVIPLRPWPGWQAYVNGHRVDVKSYLEVLTAVKIEDLPATVELRYEPISEEIGCALSLVGIVAIIIIFIFERKGIRFRTKIHTQ